MSKAYMTFPDGGRIYRDAAGRLVAYTAAGGTAARKRVKTEAAGELWLAHAWLAANPAFLPDLPPGMVLKSLVTTSPDWSNQYQ